MENGKRNQWIDLCLDLIFAAFGFDVANVSDFKKLVDHALSVCGYSIEKPQEKNQTEKVCWIYSYAGFGFHGIGNYTEALHWNRKALELAQNVYGGKHENVMKIINNTAEIFSDLGEYKTALEWHRNALAICDEILGAESAQAATIHNNIAAVYHLLGNCEAAFEGFERALKIRICSHY